MRLVLVRHGELEDSWQPDTGHLDPDLSRAGLRLAEALARELARGHKDAQPIEVVYTSPLRAARATAKVICERLGLAPAQADASFTTLTPEVLPSSEGPGSGRGLEALLALQERAWAAVEVIKELYAPETNLVICSHELPIRGLVCRALAMSPDDYRSFTIAPASLTVIEFRGLRALLASLNETCHLE